MPTVICDGTVKVLPFSAINAAYLKSVKEKATLIESPQLQKKFIEVCLKRKNKESITHSPSISVEGGRIVALSKLSEERLDKILTPILKKAGFSESGSEFFLK